MVNKKGFSLVELLGSLALLGVILCVGLFLARGTLATTLSTLNEVSVNEIYNTAEVYVIENKVGWINNGLEEYTCVKVQELVDFGYFKSGEVVTYKNKLVKVVRNVSTRVVEGVDLLDNCK